MGNLTSQQTICDSGTLLGASPSGASKPPPLRKTQKFMIKVPAGMKSGDNVTVDMNGKFVNLPVPRGYDGRVLKAGEKFEVVDPGDKGKVIASTLHALPGSTIVECKAMIFASVTQTCVIYSNEASATGVSKSVAELLQKCQGELLERTIAVGCNAVLGISSTVASDSSGETGARKVIIVTMTGTPCIVVSNYSQSFPNARLRATAPPAASAVGYNDINNIPMAEAVAVLPLSSKNVNTDDDFETRC